MILLRVLGPFSHNFAIKDFCEFEFAYRYIQWYKNMENHAKKHFQQVALIWFPCNPSRNSSSYTLSNA